MTCDLLFCVTRDGYLTCGTSLLTTNQPGLSGNTQIEMLGTVSQINCVLASLIFQGFQDENDKIQITRYGFRSSVTLKIAPNCDAALNTGCGQEFSSTFIATSIGVITAMNDPPFITACPQFFLKAIAPISQLGLRAQNGIVTWENNVGQCQNVNLFPSSNSPTIGGIPLSFEMVQPYASSPAYCQIESPTKVYPPFCARTNQSVCLPNVRSFVYHIEDLANAKLVLLGLRVWDVDLYTGDLAMEMSIKFMADYVIPLSGYLPLHRFIDCINNPLYCQISKFRASVLIGSIDYYCARPNTAYGPEVDVLCVKAKNCVNCARSQAEVIGSLPYLNGNPALRINLTNFVLSPGYIENKLFHYDMAYSINEQFGVATLEEGMLSLDFSCDPNSICSSSFGNYVVTGQMTANAGFSQASTGIRFDWYGASPLIVSGFYAYQSTQDNPLLQITVISSTVPVYDATVSVSFGNISIPMLQVPLSTDNGLSKTFSGRIDEINLALSQIEYQVPAATMPYLNTMSGLNSRYGNVQCDLKVIINDRGYMTASTDSSLGPIGQPVTNSGGPTQVPTILPPAIFTFNTMVCESLFICRP